MKLVHPFLQKEPTMRLVSSMIRNHAPFGVAGSKPAVGVLNLVILKSYDLK